MITVFGGIAGKLHPGQLSNRYQGQLVCQLWWCDRLLLWPQLFLLLTAKAGTEAAAPVAPPLSYPTDCVTEDIISELKYKTSFLLLLAITGQQCFSIRFWALSLRPNQVAIHLYKLSGSTLVSWVSLRAHGIWVTQVDRSPQYFP